MNQLKTSVAKRVTCPMCGKPTGFQLPDGRIVCSSCVKVQNGKKT